MFLNYQNIAKNYTPNNLICSYPVGKSYTKLAPIEASKPYEEYDAKGNIIGYFWHFGDTLNLEFNITGEVTVESDAILLTSGVVPTKALQGYVGQRCYNLQELRSWTCVEASDNNYIWEEDQEFTYPEFEGKSVYVPSDDYLSDKTIDVTIYNFRYQPVYKQSFRGSSKIVFEITPELSKKFKPGIYYCDVVAYNQVSSETIFSTDDCKLLVK